MLESHVTNLEQSRKLYELGFIKDSCFARYDEGLKSGAKTGEYGVYARRTGYEVPAYLLSEIMEALPSRVEHCPLFMSKDDNDTYDIRYIDGTTNANTIFKQSKNPIEAACDLLIWCIENGFYL